MSAFLDRLTRRPPSVADVLENLGRHCFENDDQGFVVTPEDCRQLAELFFGLSVRALELEGVEHMARARANAEKAMTELGIEVAVVPLTRFGLRLAAVDGRAL